MDRLISLQAAIDAVSDGILGEEESLVECVEECNAMIEWAVETLKKLPSAQPEIVRCKDCKHYGCILYSGTQFEYGECFSHEESDYTFKVKPDDFCSRAERRTDERLNQ